MTADRLTRESHSGGSWSDPLSIEVSEVLSDQPGHDDPTWMLVVSDPARGMDRVYESLLTVADGNTGTRGSLEEDGFDAEPGVFVAGATSIEMTGRSR